MSKFENFKNSTDKQPNRLKMKVAKLSLSLGALAGILSGCSKEYDTDVRTTNIGIKCTEESHITALGPFNPSEDLPGGVNFTDPDTITPQKTIDGNRERDDRDDFIFNITCDTGEIDNASVWDGENITSESFSPTEGFDYIMQVKTEDKHGIQKADGSGVTGHASPQENQLETTEGSARAIVLLDNADKVTKVTLINRNGVETELSIP